MNLIPDGKKSTTAVKNYDDLPENAKKYLSRMSELADTKIDIVSVGSRPQRNHLLFMIRLRMKSIIELPN